MSTTPTGTTETRTGTDDRSRPTATGAGRPDRWAAPGEETSAASSAAPRTFDPFCARRLRNCVDRRNAAFPDAD